MAHQVSLDGVDAILINAGAWTHYSYGLRDALAIFTGPIVDQSGKQRVAKDERIKDGDALVMDWYVKGVQS